MGRCLEADRQLVLGGPKHMPACAHGHDVRGGGRRLPGLNMLDFLDGLQKKQGCNGKPTRQLVPDSPKDMPASARRQDVRCGV